MDSTSSAMKNFRPRLPDTVDRHQANARIRTTSEPLAKALIQCWKPSAKENRFWDTPTRMAAIPAEVKPMMMLVVTSQLVNTLTPFSAMLPV